MTSAIRTNYLSRTGKEGTRRAATDDLKNFAPSMTQTVGSVGAVVQVSLAHKTNAKPVQNVFR